MIMHDWILVISFVGHFCMIDIYRQTTLNMFMKTSSILLIFHITFCAFLVKVPLLMLFMCVCGVFNPLIHHVCVLISGQHC